MPLEIPKTFLLLCFVFGSLSGYLAYFLTSLIEKIDAPNMRPFALLAYLAFIFMVVTSDPEIRTSIYIISGIFIALLGAGIVMRGNSTSVLDRIIFFGCAILMSPFLAIPGYVLLILISSKIGFDTLRWGEEEFIVLMVTYVVITVVSVFVSPFMEQLSRFAKSMRPKPN